MPKMMPIVSKSTEDLLLELPLSVIQGTHLPGFQPPGDAVEMESMLGEKHPRGGAVILLLEIQ